MLDLETHYGSIEIEFVKKLFDAIQNDLTLDLEFRLSCAQKKVEFYEEFADSIDDIVEAQNAYAAEQKKMEAKQKEEQEERLLVSILSILVKFLILDQCCKFFLSQTDFHLTEAKKDVVPSQYPKNLTHFV